MIIFTGGSLSPVGGTTAGFAAGRKRRNAAGFDCPIEERVYFKLCEPIDGGWTDFSDFSECTETNSGEWKKVKTRSCTDPAPEYGGELCDGEDFEVRLF